MEEQIDLFGPKAHTRSSDPDTSHAAAARVNKTVSVACIAVHHAMTVLGPSCDEDLQTFYDLNRDMYHWPPQRCVRKRRKDLCDLGRARYTGKKVMNPVGLQVREWEAV